MSFRTWLIWMSIGGALLVAGWVGGGMVLMVPALVIFVGLVIAGATHGFPQVRR